jgi:hypothetical protein
VPTAWVVLKDKDKTKKGSGYKPLCVGKPTLRNKNRQILTYLISPYRNVASFKFMQTNKLHHYLLVTGNHLVRVRIPIVVLGLWSRSCVNVVYVLIPIANTVYIGSPVGGIWKSTTGGQTGSVRIICLKLSFRNCC